MRTSTTLFHPRGRCVSCWMAPTILSKALRLPEQPRALRRDVRPAHRTGDVDERALGLVHRDPRRDELEQEIRRRVDLARREQRPGGLDRDRTRETVLLPDQLEG